MKAIVDADECTGCGLCTDTCPTVFEMDSAVAKVLVVNVPEDAMDSCREAAANCPVEAIKIEE
jgi:ferredoxin